MKRGFYHLSRAWYAETGLKNRDYIDEVTFGIYCNQGGTKGEMSVKWVEFSSWGDKVTPRLDCFDDAWLVLSEFKDVIDEMAKVDSQNIKPEEFCQLLIKCGFEDLTPTERK